MGIGAPELLIILVVVLVAAIATSVDAARLPPAAFARAGSNRAVWIVLPIVGIFFCGLVTIIAAIMWFASVKPRVVAAAQGA